MRWHELLIALGQAAAGNVTLAGIYGETIRLAGRHAHIIPSIDIRMISDTEVEQWAPHIIQFDQWTETLEDLAASDAALLELFNQDLPVLIGADFYTWCTFTDHMTLVGPDESNYYGLATRFRFTPLRKQYAVAQGS